MIDTYGRNGADMSTFVKLPMFLFTDSRFVRMSNDAKILYAFMLNRAELSQRNGWVDAENRVYIFYTLADAMALLNRSRPKCCAVFSELETAGLIHRQQQGVNRAAVIYVENVNDRSETFTEQQNVESVESVETLAVENVENLNQQCSAVKNFYYRGKKSLPQQSKIFTTAVKNFYPSQNNLKRKKELDLVSQSVAQNFEKNPKTIAVKTDRTDKEQVKREIYENIGYDALLGEHRGDVVVGKIAELIIGVVTGERRVYIKGNTVSKSLARERFLMLRREHIEHVIEKMHGVRNSRSVKNPAAYICAALFNATYEQGISKCFGFNCSGTSYDLSLIDDYADCRVDAAAACTMQLVGGG